MNDNGALHRNSAANRKLRLSGGAERPISTAVETEAEPEIQVSAKSDDDKSSSVEEPDFRRITQKRETHWRF